MFRDVNTFLARRKFLPSLICFYDWCNTCAFYLLLFLSFYAFVIYTFVFFNVFVSRLACKSFFGENEEQKMNYEFKFTFLSNCFFAAQVAAIIWIIVNRIFYFAECVDDSTSKLNIVIFSHLLLALAIIFGIIGATNKNVHLIIANSFCWSSSMAISLLLQIGSSPAPRIFVFVAHSIAILASLLLAAFLQQQNSIKNFEKNENLWQPEELAWGGNFSMLLINWVLNEGGIFNLSSR